TMKVQTKIALLIVLVVAIFMAGLWGFRAYDKAKFRRITAERFDERRNAFDLFWEKDGEPLKTLAEYDTTWDDMVKAIQQKNIKWLQENVSDETLLGYKANAVWIYDSAATLIYSRNSSNARPLDLPIPREAFAQLFSGIPSLISSSGSGTISWRFAPQRFMDLRIPTAKLPNRVFSLSDFYGIQRC